MPGKLSKSEQVTLELKTYQIELGFSGGGVVKFYAEDALYEKPHFSFGEPSGLSDKPIVLDGLKGKMKKLSEPGWVLIDKQKNFYRPHKDISYLQVLDSTVTKVITLTKSNGKWEITNEE